MEAAGDFHIWTGNSGNTYRILQKYYLLLNNSILTVPALAETILIEKLIGLESGLLEKVPHGHLPKGKVLPVTRVLWVLMELVVLERIFPITSLHVSK